MLHHGLLSMSFGGFSHNGLLARLRLAPQIIMALHPLSDHSIKYGSVLRVDRQVAGQAMCRESAYPMASKSGVMQSAGLYVVSKLINLGSWPVVKCEARIDPELEQCRLTTASSCSCHESAWWERVDRVDQYKQKSDTHAKLSKKTTNSLSGGIFVEDSMCLLLWIQPGSFNKDFGGYG